jgi:prepilin-type N-terminal cleavage/methylation domain-containing protein
MRLTRGEQTRGFTLLEVVISLVIAAILMALIIPYLGTALTKSGFPLLQLRTTMAVFQAMENMNANYRAQQDGATLNLPTLRTTIGAENTNRTNAYGTYKVVRNRFIQFNGAGQEIAAGANQDILKVTIQDVNGGPQFTTLFTRDLP